MSGLIFFFFPEWSQIFTRKSPLFGKALVQPGRLQSDLESSEIQGLGPLPQKRVGDTDGD